MNYVEARFRQIAADKGFLWALGYATRCCGTVAANAVEEQFSRAAAFISGFLPQKEQSNRIKTMTFRDYMRLKAEDGYYEGRWNYLRRAIDIIKRESPEKVLELGPRRMPVVKGADTMDVHIHGPKLTYIHDARTVPWPIRDKEYDLFIALQVWEHLEGKQIEAFREVMRVSRAAIMSFPYKLFSPGGCHHEIDEKVISEWTLRVRPEKIIRTGHVIVYFFRF